MSWLVNLGERFFAFAFACLLLQLPFFMQQYQIRLEGHANELALQVSQVESLANGSGKSFFQYITKFLESPDQDIAAQGRFLKQLQERRDKIQKDLSSLLSATSFSRPFLFFTSLDWSIARQTLNAFQPGLTFSIESGCYVLVGLLLGSCFFKAFLLPFRRRPQVAV